MVRKKSLFDAPEQKTSAERASDYERLKYAAAHAHKQRWDAFNQYEIDTSKPWYEQVLSLERAGKKTTITAHEMAQDAIRRSGGVREPGED